VNGRCTQSCGGPRGSMPQEIDRAGDMSGYGQFGFAGLFAQCDALREV
jgi:hypothetical protein